MSKTTMFANLLIVGAVKGYIAHRAYERPLILTLYYIPSFPPAAVINLFVQTGQDFAYIRCRKRFS